MHTALSLHQLRAVVAVARYGSFVAAASDLATSQPALSRAIKQAEEILGVVLFARSTRHVALTAAGREFAPAAERMLNELELQIQNVRELAEQRRGHLVIACLMSIAHSVLPGVIATYRRTYPRIELFVREGVQSSVADEVRSGAADFGIGDMAGGDAPLHGEPLQTEACHVVLPRRHRLASRMTLRLNDLVGESVITMPVESGLRRLIDGAVAGAGVRLTYAITVNQFATIYEFIGRGLGVAIVPASVLPSRRDALLIARPLREPRIMRQVGILTRPDRPLSPAATGFLALLRTHYRSAPASIGHSSAN